MLWVSDDTYTATWAGFIYVAFVIDTYARRIVGWRASRTAHTGLVLDSLYVFRLKIRCNLMNNWKFRSRQVYSHSELSYAGTEHLNILK